MEYETSISESGGYISVKVNQPMTNDLGRRLGTDVARLANEKNIKKFLVDVRKAPNLHSVTDDYVYAYKDMDNFGFTKSMQSALLISPDDSSHDFIATVFRNAGYQVKIFTDENTAISWLEKEDEVE